MIFTSDTHFYHKNVIEYSHRPFSSVEEMNEELIVRWNRVVRPKDIIYHLGDFALTTELTKIDQIIDRLNGRIRLIRGNHDKWVDRLDKLKFKHKIEWVKDYYETKYAVSPSETVKVCMMHYPLRTWNQSHRGSYNLHAHCHGSLDIENYTLGIRRLDVGVDSNDYTPITFSEIHRELSLRQNFTFHHGD